MHLVGERLCALGQPAAIFTVVVFFFYLYLCCLHDLCQGQPSREKLRSSVKVCSHPGDSAACYLEPSLTAGHATGEKSLLATLGHPL